MSEFVTADSGERLEFDSGMKRDTADGKINWLLVIPGPMLKRWAELMTRGSAKYEADRRPGELRNWQKASGEAELERFQESAIRHFMHWLYGTNETNPETGEPIIEDHAAGVYFNINGAEYVRAKSVELTERLKLDYSKIVVRGAPLPKCVAAPVHLPEFARPCNLRPNNSGPTAYRCKACKRTVDGVCQ